MATKILWIVNGDPNTLLNHAKQIGASAVAVRSDNHWLAGSIKMFHTAGMKVHAWRWPGVQPTDDPPNYYAPDQAKFVVQTLIPAGLDGYIADIESDGTAHPQRDWNNRALASMATSFSSLISGAGKKHNPNFIFGLTSGFDFPTAYPHIPWDAFVSFSDAVYPQVYWRGDGGAVVGGGTPEKAWTRTLASWKSLDLGVKPIIPIIGQIQHISPQSIADFRALMIANKMGEVHAYSDDGVIAQANWAALNGL